MNSSPYSTITRPTLLVDRTRVERNILRMSEKARRSGVRLRPHFKTHQSAGIGSWFRSYGVDAIAVSSLQMAEYFAQHGWRDILVAFPFNPREIDAVNRLARFSHLQILLDNSALLARLESELESPVRVWIDVDAGYGRTGIPAASEDEVVALADQVASIPALSLAGLYEHAGHTYNARTEDEVQQRFRSGIVKLERLRQILASAGHDQVLIGAGDTPGCLLAEDFAGLDEIHPGNFALCDLTQWQLGTCALDDIASVVACPVVSVYEHRSEFVIHGGAVHLSKERLGSGSDAPLFGKAIALRANAWDPSDVLGDVVSVSQEVGIVRVPKDKPMQVRVGDLVGVLPVHSCLAASALGRFVTTEGQCLDSMGSCAGGV